MQRFIVERTSAQYSYMKDEDNKKTDNYQGEGVEGENSNVMRDIQSVESHQKSEKWRKVV